MGAQAGGGGNFNIYSMNTIVPYEGMINENYFRISQRETELAANLETFKSVTKNPFTNRLEYFLGLLIKSKYDGIGRQMDQIDISIALDISGSMGCGINPKPTFEEMLQHQERMPYRESSKNRITIAKECLFKLVNSMTDKMNLALTTFDTASQLIIPLSPKREILSISNVINTISANGGTDLTVALKGAADCLKESTAKFKRVIIITDGWDNSDSFMSLAKELNKKDILITVLSIDSGSNSDMYDKLSELKGCNYYFILNEHDMEKYLIKQLNYICFPALYDMKINFLSDDAYLIRAIGCGQENEKSKKIEDGNNNNDNSAPTVNQNLINTKTIFPSDLKELNGSYYQEGGLILLKIQPKSFDKKCKVVLNLSYQEIEGNTFDKNYEIEFSPEELKKEGNSSEMKKGLAIYYFTKFIRKIKKFMNCNVQIDAGGPKEIKGERPDIKYFNFLSRNCENYDKIKMYFEANYNNDLNKCQKEYYLKNLDDQYAEVENKKKEYRN